MKNLSMQWQIFCHKKNEDGSYIASSIPNAFAVKNRVNLTIFAVLSSVITCAFLSTLPTVIVASCLVMGISLVDFIIIAGILRKKNLEPKNCMLTLETIESFPLYTVVVPIFMESHEDIINLRKNIRKIKYPNIEVIYVIEEIDLNVIFFFEHVPLEDWEKYVIIPRMKPCTKPKACNYALEFAKGKYIVVYDIEDKPHPHQLHFAHYFFTKNPQTACIQFPLEFCEGIFVHQFWQRIDYIRWYNLMLNAVMNFKLPIPLGGTSNHFVVKDLRMLGGWDSYNVTEDAEIGIRMFAMGYGVHYAYCFPTIEKPVENIANLHNQRVRWAKGHLITLIQTGGMLIKNKQFLAFVAIFYILASRWVVFVCSILCIICYLLCFDIFQSPMLMVAVCANIGIFFSIPLQLLCIKKIRNLKTLPAIFTYNIFYIFYCAIFFNALLECVKKPFSWYKTLR